MRPAVRELLAHVKDACFAFESGSLASLAFWASLRISATSPGYVAAPLA